MTENEITIEDKITIEDVEAELEGLFATDFDYAEPSNIDAKITEVFSEIFKDKIGEGNSKNFAVATLCKAFKMDVTTKRKIVDVDKNPILDDNGNPTYEDVTRKQLPKDITEALADAGFFVDKLRGVAGYSITLPDPNEIGEEDEEEEDEESEDDFSEDTSDEYEEDEELDI